jgi:acyl-coenzyme A synthetase/AMP-(fatty) acid ligase
VRPADDLARELRRDSARPWLTWYDDADGARVELSVATTANWVAKIANWLVDEDDVGPGDTVTPTAGAHWLAPLCALAAWTVGAGLGPDGTEVPPGGDAAAFQRAVLAQPDVLTGPASPAEVGDPPVEAPPAARVLAPAGPDGGGGTAALLAVLRSGGSLVLVANPDPERLAARAATERVTHTAGCDVAGLPRIC